MTKSSDANQNEPVEDQPQEQQKALSDQTASPENEVSILALISNQQELFHLNRARRREAKRRLKMLGDFAQHDFDKQQLRTLARERYISEQLLTEWKRCYLQQDMDGLLPQDWFSLPEKSQQKVIERLQALGELTEATTITAKQIYQLAEKCGWHLRKAERTVQRYQIGGVWGLAPEHDPERKHRPKQSVPPIDYAAATSKARETADKRLALIQPYIGKKHIPNEEMKTYAEKHGSSLRAMRDYLARFKKWGLPGLLPKEGRSDKGHPHNMSELMEDIIAALRFSQMDIPLHEIHAQAKRRAYFLGQPEPTPWQVRYVCDRIPEEEKLVADKRFGQFRNERRLTYRFQFDGSVIIYQIDFTRVDVLLRDIRKRGYRTQSEEIRPYLITCMECSSRLILAKLLTYDVPDSNDIAAVIREALLVTDEKPFGGIPHAIWVDQGGQLISQHVRRIAADLHFELKEGKPNHPEDRGDPQERGEEERFFGTLNTRLWSTLEGYVNSNTKARNPNAKATYTITELAQKLDAFIDEYHHTVHSETKMTPLEFWATKCQAREDAPPRNLDVLLLAAVTRTLNKDHIHYGNRRYWHDDLAEIPVGAKVEVRAQPDYMRPNEIEVFYNGHHLCTAFAHDSVKGREVTGVRVLAAQRRQTQRIRATIRQKKNALQNADRQIKAQQKLLQQPESGTPTTPDDPMAKQEGRGVQETPTPPNPQGPPRPLSGRSFTRSPSETNKQSIRASSRSSSSQRSPWAIALEVQENQQKKEEKKG